MLRPSPPSPTASPAAPPSHIGPAIPPWADMDTPSPAGCLWEWQCAASALHTLSPAWKSNRDRTPRAAPATYFFPARAVDRQNEVSFPDDAPTVSFSAQPDP